MEENKALVGHVHSLETFGLVDGPGVRTVVFLQGCRMCCRYCHNPATWSMSGGEERPAKDLFNRVYRYRTYWKNNGGITVSGGEPLLQIDFLTEIFTLAKEKGIHTTLDTSGNPFTREEPFYSKWKKLMEVTDLVMLDIKHIDEKVHQTLTGQTGENIKEMAREMSDMGQPMWIRHVLIPGDNSQDKYLIEMREFIQTLKTVERVEILPYHTLGVFKWEQLGIDYPLKGVNPPTQEEVKHAEELLGI